MKAMASFKLKRKGAKKFALWQEITVVLIIKVAMILAIWHFCFSDPVEKHLTISRMQQQLVGK